MTLIGREPTPRHKVFGEFLSGEALEDLHALGIDVASPGTVPISPVRLEVARCPAQASLPFAAASLTRKTLDTALVTAAVRLKPGRSVRSLSRAASKLWQATLDNGTTFVATIAFSRLGQARLARQQSPEVTARLMRVAQPAPVNPQEFGN